MILRTNLILAVAVLLVAAPVSRADDLFDAMNKSDAAGLAKLLAADKTLANKAKDGIPPLNYACRGSNFKIVKLLIDAGADVHAIDLNGCTALHHAAGNRNRAILELLLDKGAKVDAVNKENGKTPLFAAAREGFKANVVLLLDKGAHIDGGCHPKLSNPPWTPLYEAVASGRLGAAELLLLRGANPNLKGSIQGAPLDKAAENSDRDMIRLLLKHGADVHSDRAFVEALRGGQRDLVELFLNRGVDVKKPEYLQTAAWTSKDMVALLLDRGANPRDLDAHHRNALHAAAQKGDAAILALLLARGADARNVDNEQLTPLHQATNRIVAELLVASGADVNAAAKDGSTPLLYALNRGNKDVAEALAKRDAKLDAFSMAALGRADELRKYLKDNPIPKPANRYQLTALHLAAWYGQNETLTVLLDRGAKVESATWDGQTPLHLAVRGGHKATVELLLKKGADLNAKTSFETFQSRRTRTPLHLALAAGRVEMVRLLVEKGALPKLEGAVEKQWWNEATDRKDLAMLRYFLERGLPIDAELGRTPTSLVRLAAEQGDLAALKGFVAQGADLKKKSASGDTPLRAAVRGKQKAVVEYLVQQGADVHDPVALRWAVYQGDKKTVELLLSKGAALHHADDYQETSLLRNAVRGNQLDMLKLLLARGADVKRDTLVLHFAAFQGRKPMVEKLLESGADLEGTGAAGTGFFLFTVSGAFQKQPEVLEFFTEPKKSFLNPGTPLHAAIAGMQKDVVELLLTKGAKVDAKLPNGSPPLHLAVYLGDLETVKVLLAHKADIDAKDASGLTALKLAEREGRKEMAVFLRKQGAKDDN